MTLPSDYLKRTGYRLPSEAEWEYACRANTITSRYYGDADSLLGEYAWFLQVSDYRTWRVASLKPNGFGLFDMLGNVQEWCQEANSPYSRNLGSVSEVVEDTEPLEDSGRRSLRGGSFGVRSPEVRSAYRGFNRRSINTTTPAFASYARMIERVPHDDYSNSSVPKPSVS